MSSPQQTSLRDWCERLESMRDSEPAEDKVAIGPDDRRGNVYRTPESLVMAIKVALATERPLLLTGPPGSGKSSIGAYVARNLAWSLHEQVISSRTEAEDILWIQDHVGRLAAAQAGEDLDNETSATRFMAPGVLWQAINPASASELGSTASQPNRQLGSVVLLDEMDKAHPDVPNALLVPLGSLRFHVAPLDRTIERASIDGAMRPVLTIITSNGDRELPPAFVRRCIVHELAPHGPSALIDIAKRHFTAKGMTFDEQARSRAEALAELIDKANRTTNWPAMGRPSTAEYLDALFAAVRLAVSMETETWEQLIEAAVVKYRDNSP